MQEIAVEKTQTMTDSVERHMQLQREIIEQRKYNIECFGEILSKYGFTDQNGKRLEDYEVLVRVIENEENFTDALGHPLKNCIDYKRLKKAFCNAPSQSIDPIHNMFGLSYSSYLILRRSVLQSAPLLWQQKFCALLEDLQEMFDDEYLSGSFTVQMREEKGRFVRDGYADYERGRRQIPMKDR